LKRSIAAEREDGERWKKIIQERENDGLRWKKALASAKNEKNIAVLMEYAKERLI
jgi:hypothetical protein